MKPLFFLSLLLPLFAGCQEQPRNFFGRTGTIVLRQPAKIEAWRIHGDSPSPAKELDVAMGQQLAKILEDPSTFDFEMAKGCKFDPIAGFRLTRDKRVIEVLLCFRCNELKLISPDPVSKRFPSRVADFDPGKAELVKFVKQVFPDDAEIQGLK
jgi:hypothetical protein